MSFIPGSKLKLAAAHSRRGVIRRYHHGQIIDKAVDFMASSQAFREYLKKLPPRNAIPSGIPDESVPLYLQRLEYYRQLYRPKQVEEK